MYGCPGFSRARYNFVSCEAAAVAHSGGNRFCIDTCEIAQLADGALGYPLVGDTESDVHRRIFSRRLDTALVEPLRNGRAESPLYGTVLHGYDHFVA